MVIGININGEQLFHYPAIHGPAKASWPIEDW
jgi:hypothetical protein